MLDLNELSSGNSETVRLLDPTSLRIIILGYIYPVDVGSWCYLERRKKSNDTSTDACAIFLTNPQSLRAARSGFIEQFVHYLVERLQEGRSPNTLKSIVGQFKTYVDWCDIHHVDAFDSEKSYVESVRHYTEYAIERIRRKKLKINTAAAMQLVIFSVGKAVYGDDYGDLYQGIRKIKKSIRFTQITQKPDEVSARESLTLYTEAFDQISQFILTRGSYPHKLDLSVGEFWCFPNSIPIAGPSTISKKYGLKEKFKAYCYKTGSLRTVDEILQSLTKPEENGEYRALQIWQAAQDLVASSNVDYYNSRRVQLAILAAHCFTMLFFANTAMNLAVAAGLPICDSEIDISKSDVEFRNVKYRAKGREVSFFISRVLIPRFNKYLELRQYILEALDEVDFDFLFFSVSRSKPRQLKRNFSTDFHIKINTAFGHEAKITTRMWRAHKSDWLTKNRDLDTAALILQNSPETLVRHYLEGSDSDQSSEVSGFFDSYIDSLIITSSVNSTPISTGQCVELNEPGSILDKELKIEPNCKTPEGCLLCDKYRIHADLIDYRKLLSCQYVLGLMRAHASDTDHFYELFGVTLKRLEGLIEVLKQALKRDQAIDEDEVQKVESDVYDEEILDPYWLRKLSLIEDLEVVS